LQASAISPLFEPYKLGPLLLPNRIAMAPMTRSFSPGGVPGPDVAAYYRRRAEGGAALLITEGTYVGHQPTHADPAVPDFYGEGALAGWRKVVEAVHRAGACIMPQLWHIGLVTVRKSSLSLEPAYRSDLELVGPSGILWPNRLVTKPMSASDIEAVIEAFAIAARDAQRLGFDGIELHGAHGYLIDQFFWDHTNRRSDRYGGSLANRGHFAGDIIAEIRHRTRSDFPVLLRISQWKQQDYGARMVNTPEELVTLLEPSVKAGVTMIHCSQRRFWEPAFEGSDLNLAGWVKKITGLPTMTVGSVGLNVEFLESLVQQKAATPVGIERLAAMIARGEFDMVAIGRALLGDPLWPKKISEGRVDELKGFEASALQTLY
jgi:2,4-dienoyl-CoA reductase-like NADH-dependent reductase (Old Yellow Enzyme family)